MRMKSQTMQSSVITEKNGFTLAEVIIVVVITGVLATLALPRFTSTFERVRAAEGVHLLTALLGAQKSYQFENGAYATDPAVLDVEITRANNFNTPPTVANPGNPVTSPIARIRRTGAYWLEINEEGTISCVNAGSTFTCAQAGY